MNSLPDDVLELIIKHDLPQLLMVNWRGYRLVKKNLNWLINNYRNIWYYLGRVEYRKSLIHEKCSANSIEKRDLEKGIKIRVSFHETLMHYYPYMNHTHVSACVITSKYISIGFDPHNMDNNHININLAYDAYLSKINIVELVKLWRANISKLVIYVLDKEDWDIGNFLNRDLVAILTPLCLVCETDG